MDEDRRRDHISAYAYTVDHFERRGSPYELTHADSPSLRMIFHRLRYQIQCVEHPEIKERRMRSSLEFENKEDHSEYYLLQFKPLNLFFGGVRIILPQKEKAFKGLPAVADENSPFHAFVPFPSDSTAEISTFMISKELTRVIRKHVWENPIAEKSLMPPLMHLLGLLHIKKSGMSHFCALLEPRFARLMKSYGIPLINYGEPIQSNGLRQACYADCQEVLDTLKEKNLRLYNFILDK